MSEVTLNLKDYKASGVYFVEVDNSISTGTTNTALRLAVGFNERGPFNRPIYFSNTADCDELLGGIDRKLERRGCYTNRNVRTMVSTAPVYALNLLNVNTSTDESNKDIVGFNAISFDASVGNIAGTVPFAGMYDRSRFWVADASTMMSSVDAAVIADASVEGATDSIHSPLYSFGNCGTQDVSIIVRKAEGLTGYNVTFLDWYGSADAIPYSWINPYDYVADYFVQVIAVAGNYTDYDAFASDSVWKAYFDKDGIKRDKLNKFLRLDAVNVLGNWIGCIVPDFYDKQGKCKSLDYLINKNCNKTGLMFGYNTAALDVLRENENYDPDASVGSETIKCYLDVASDVDEEDQPTKEAPFQIDLIGANISADDIKEKTIKMLSYEALYDASTACTMQVHKGETAASFYLDEDEISGSGDCFLPIVGDYVRAANGRLTKIVKRRVGYAQRPVQGSTEIEEVLRYTYTAADAIKTNVVPIQTYGVRDDMNIDNDGETMPENPGYQDYMVYGDTSGSDVPAVGETIGIEIRKSIEEVYTHLKFLPLRGLKIANRHRPGFDKDGNMDIEAGVEKIYSMLAEHDEDGKTNGIWRGLMNNEMIDFRYVVDTMGGGLGEETRGKKYLSELAKSKQHCTAVLNAPSISDFANSNAPIFCDDYIDGVESKPSFDVKYIPDGGNQDHAYTSEYEDFTLPDEENGSKHAAYFSPYLRYTVGTKDILIPPAADVCNVFTNKFLGGDPTKTTANRTGILNNSQISGLEYDFDDTDRGYLEPFGINPIIRRGTTYMIYGDRTAYQVVDSDLNFLHNRELLNTIELRCKATLDDYPFTYNNATTRAEIYTRLDPILRALKDSGALAKYEIQVDEYNNTKEVIDAKCCIVDIGVWFTPTMEKIVTRITVNRGSEA